MSFEYIRYRFRMHQSQSLLELAQVAALKSLRDSPRCRGWRVLPAPGDPSVSLLAIEWDPGPQLTPFRGSQEFAALHAALDERVRALEEADYRADTHLLRRIVGGTEALFRLAEAIVTGIMEDPELGPRFASVDGSKRGRLGLWLLEVLGGPDLFSSSFPDALAGEGPLEGELLDLADRDRLLEIAAQALPNEAEEQGRCVVGALRAHLPLHPPPPSARRAEARLLPYEAEMADDDVTTILPIPWRPTPGEGAGDDALASPQLALFTQVRHIGVGDVPVSSRITVRPSTAAAEAVSGGRALDEGPSSPGTPSEEADHLLSTGTETDRR